jgi:hypothetical protein
MSDNALAQRRRNLRVARERNRLWRCQRESDAIRRLIQQWEFDPAPKMSVRALARKLGVWPSYVRRIRDNAKREGLDVRLRATWDELAKARDVTERGREQMPELFAPVRSRRAPVSKLSADGPAHVSPEEFERTRRAADTEAALERLRQRLGKCGTC